MYRHLFSVMLSAVVLGFFVGPLGALTIGTPAHRQFMSGSVRMVEVQGTYATVAGEQVTLVRIIALDASGRELSAAWGSWNPTKKEWSASLGDYRMASYYVEFTTKYQKEAPRKWNTPVYKWGR